MFTVNSQTKQQSGIMKIKLFEYNIELFKKNVYNIKKRSK